ncbi:Putative Zn-dependent protease, contains TPR repeats [Desulfacinum infernum DSM 9756]|uniref:Putative Zn-dependent protease, contains TPR repeats n=1 Tax=Desulfacinum infernum DSM 9756 TaxID=1121391 RepID=A0A1M4Y0L7_9BACT|nr:M48 family metallopeptidase [Desulfacinum infernum]SHE99377.1 Putative Zn-dependent protease, contains TPR repeats [Desulfacinum infernum DSM 9756]
MACSRSKSMGKSGWRILGFLALLAALAACAVNPVTHQSQLSLMSEQQEIATGQKLYPLYTQMSYGLFQDGELQAYVQDIGRRLAAVSHRPNMAYEFNVVNSSDLNAYALPGGKISITRGLVAKMENEAQLASVLGHEIAHVAALHPTSTYTRQVLGGLLTSVGSLVLQTAGVPGGDLISQAGLLATNLTLMKYSRDQEREADELGMEYMVRAGYNPAGFVQSMAILMDEKDREPSQLESFFSSHPLTTERVAEANRRLARYGPELRTPEALKRETFLQKTSYLRRVQPAYELMDRAKKALSEKRSREALGLLRQATSQAPREALLWVYRAVAEDLEDNERQALSAARKAVELYPDLYHARYVAGVITFNSGAHRESLQHLQAADRLVPEQPPVTFYMGRNWEALGRRDQAARAYYAVLQKVKKGPMAQYCYRRLVQWGYIR